MAGGKETPRQKMIGMMYLVLTALLALNVSKSILDAFVAIEESTQKANIVQYDKGNLMMSAVQEELGATKGADQKAKREKLEYVLKKMEEIDKISGKMIVRIDGLKKLLLEKSGEVVDKVENGSEEAIMWSKPDAKNPSLPVRMHLMAVQAKDQYDVPMQIMTGAEKGGTVKDIKGEGAQLWKELNDFRAEIVEKSGSYEWGGKQFTVKTKAFNEYKDNKDLNTKVTKMIEGTKGNLKEDKQVLIDLYVGLTKEEFQEVHGVEKHWIGAIFDHSPVVAAVASLSALEQDVLAARALAMAHWKSKVSTGEYSFNKIMPLAYGPSVVNGGDSLTIQVMMAAFDSDNQPVVTMDTEGIESKITYPGNGQGYVTMKAAGSTMELTGTVSIKNKSGVKKTEKWSKNVIIMKPSGAIELPELNVLYRGYNNLVEVSASGYDKANLTGSGVNISASGTGYIVKPSGRAKTATLTVVGSNTATGQKASLKTVTYRCMNMPAPDIYWGAAPSGNKASKNETKLFAKYGPEIPLKASFKIVSWECSVAGAARSIKGTGGNISKASALIRAAKPGTQVTFMCRVVGPDGVAKKKGGIFKI